MRILKFGGTSISTPERIKNVLSIVKRANGENRRIGVVFSALGGVTDQLIEMSSLAADNQNYYLNLFDSLEKRHLEVIERLIPPNKSARIQKQTKDLLTELKDTLHGILLVKELSPKTLDFIMSFGERLSSQILTHCLQSRKVKAEFLDARTCVKTDENFGSVKVHQEITRKNIRDHFKSHQGLQVITGFIGSSPNQATTTLGRSGSDYTAALFAAALNAKEIEIWTDVNGVMTSDPRKVPKAFSIDSLTYEEAMEMSHFGARVIYPPTIQPAMDRHIPIRIRNTFNPEFEGTVIGKTSPSTAPVKGISSIDDIALLRVQGSGMIGVVGISHRLFGALAAKNINVILISQASSEHSICFAVSPKDANPAKSAIEEAFSLEMIAKQMDPVPIEVGLSIVAVVGENMRKTTGISSCLFQALGKNGVNVTAIAQGSSELNVSVVVSKTDEAKALNALHDAFFLSETKSLHIFLMGVGLIGKTLLQQIQKQSDSLSKEYGLDIRLVSLANTKKLIFDVNGIDIKSWKDVLEKSGQKSNVKDFVQTMKKLNLPNTIFVDCTSSEEVVSFYRKILNSSISIVTPNKKANSDSFENYRMLKLSALKHGVKFLYETNVGAGLPVLSTLNDLLNSGDKIIKIEAILSGTLSFIFNQWNRKKRFSEIVREAKEKGLSEPDPRDDLNGLDVARKLLILAREIGLSLEMEDIHVENILPETCRKTKSLDGFFKELEKTDPLFDKRLQQAESKNHKLRYIAELENKKARVVLKEVSSRHPFFELSGSDNMIVFTTQRYRERPLVIKGPGAGAEVTAAGVFADIIRIANYLS